MEKREHRRIPALAGEEDQVLIKVGSEYFPASLVDMSIGGVLVALQDSSVEFPLRDYCLLFTQNGNPIFSVRAWALRREKAGRIGFQFFNLTSSDRMQIHRKLVGMQIRSLRATGS